MNFQQNIQLAEKIQEDGFAIIENILSNREIIALRKSLKLFFMANGLPMLGGLTQPNAAVETPEISWIFHHPKILHAVRQALGQEEIVFTSHCDAHTRTLSGWHKDDGMQVMPGGYFGHPMYDQNKCKVYKVAVYLQDHSNNDLGLTVRRGSNRLATYDQGEEVYLKTRPGDIVIFDARITHTGQRWVISPNSRFHRPIKFLKRGLNKLFKIDHKTTDRHIKSFCDRFFDERMSIFFTYGLPNEYTRLFAINNMKRQILQSGKKDILLPSELTHALQRCSVLTLENEIRQLLAEDISQEEFHEAIFRL